MCLPAVLFLHSPKQFLFKIQERTTIALVAWAVLHKYETPVFDQLPVNFQNCFWNSQKGLGLTRQQVLVLSGVS